MAEEKTKIFEEFEELQKLIRDIEKDLSLFVNNNKKENGKNARIKLLSCKENINDIRKNILKDLKKTNKE